MCGRYVLTEPRRLSKRFGLGAPVPASLKPNYNVAPTQDMPTIIRKDGKNLVKIMHWGIVPVWAKDKPRFAFSTFNARAESLLEKPMWKKVFPSKRCLVPANGFYEWQKRADGKQPFYIHSKEEELFAFAGLYDEWVDKDTGEIFDSYTIITTSPNKLMRSIHDRMPVILEKDEEAAWLDDATQDAGELMTLLDSYAADEMEAYEVDARVGNVRNNSRDLLNAI